MGLAAGLGSVRWRRTLVVYALIALGLYLISGVIFYVWNVTLFNERLGLPFDGAMDTITRWQQYAQLATISAIYSGAFGTISAFLAFVLAGRARQWSWFTMLLLAAVTSAIAFACALDPFGLSLVIKDDKQALEVFSSTLYACVVNALAMMTLIAQLLYAFFAARAPTAAAPKGTTTSIADDITLP
jgi:hypothetical protein